MKKINALTERYLLRIFRYAKYVEKGLNTPEELVSYINTIREDFCEERIVLLEDIVNE